MAAGSWVDWNTGDLVTAAAFQDIQDSIVFIFADETAANAALTNKVEGTIFYDTTANVLKAWDGSAWISAETGDISAVTAGDGLSGGGSSGDVTLDLDLNELTAASVDVANDSIAIVDATDNSSKKESIADLATAMADGSTITASAGVLSAAGGGRVLQVVEGTYATTTTITSTSYTDTNLTASITPSATSSKILVIVQHNTQQYRTLGTLDAQIQLLRDATQIRENYQFLEIGGATSILFRNNPVILCLDTPSTTSSITYKTQAKIINTSSSHSIATSANNLTDTITLIEIDGS